MRCHVKGTRIKETMMARKVETLGTNYFAELILYGRRQNTTGSPLDEELYLVSALKEVRSAPQGP